MIDVEKNEDLFQDVELQTPENTDVGVSDVIDDGRPSIVSPEWNDYAMSLFEANELIDGRPVVAGLRRVAEMLLGDIISSGPVQVFPPSDDKSIGRATVVWQVEFSNGTSFSDVADCWEGNTDDMFCVYAVATAATRAEGRALRKALRLRTVAAEEMTKKNTADIARSISQASGMETTQGEYEEQGRMTDAQGNFIDVKCRQLNINGTKFFKEIFNASSKRKLTKQQASDAIEKLNDFQRRESDVPESILGYKEDWRN